MKKIRLVKPHLPRLEEIQDDVRATLESGHLTNFGAYSERLEMEVRQLLGVKHALCVSNATTGLMLLLSTLPERSEVLVPSFTFLPTVQPILWNSLAPVFVDIDPESYTILPDLVASNLSNETAAILAVNTFGAPCAIEQLGKVARSKGVRLFFDSAHALGSMHNDRYLGGFGDAEVFSLSATKLLPCGEGGVITTNDDSIFEAILNGRNYGFVHKGRDCSNLGLNGKITEFSAILGLRGIGSLNKRVRRRNEIAQAYYRHLSALPGLSFQRISPGDMSTYKDFTVVVDSQEYGMDRVALRNELGGRGIETASYFSPAIHQMTYFRRKSFRQTQMDNTNLIQERIVSLPIYSDLSNEELEYVVQAMQDVHRAARS